MYQPKSEFTGGSIDKVVCDIADYAYIDVEALPGRRHVPRLTQVDSLSAGRA
jgi:hypothetical protein